MTFDDLGKHESEAVLNTLRTLADYVAKSEKITGAEVEALYTGARLALAASVSDEAAQAFTSESETE